MLLRRVVLVDLEAELFDNLLLNALVTIVGCSCEADDGRLLWFDRPVKHFKVFEHHVIGLVNNDDAILFRINVTDGGHVVNARIVVLSRSRSLREL